MVFSVIVLSVTSLLFSNNSKTIENAVELANVEALAGGEIEVAFCVVHTTICVSFEDLTFIWGYRQY